ncbi:DUF1778 domain-containing protein, partial [Rhodocyclaceae bacterium SMB388]
PIIFRSDRPLRRRSGHADVSNSAIGTGSLYGNLPYNTLQEKQVMPTAINTARLEARISTDLHAMLKRAAELQGRTMTDFVVAAVQDAAQRAIEEAEVIRLSLADQECFAQALLSPPQSAPALERAFARRRKLLRAE